MYSDLNPETRVTLIAKMRDSGDEDAWSEFVQIYQPVVQRFIQRHGLQDADAAEVTQEVLIRVAKSIESWDRSHSRATFRGWLYTITRNIAIDFLRKKRVERRRIQQGDVGLSDIADPNDQASKDLFHAELKKQIFNWAAAQIKERFKPINWQAFWLTSVEGQSIDEVAKKLGLECSAIYVARSRIISRLSKLIQSRMDEVEGDNLPSEMPLPVTDQDG